MLYLKLSIVFLLGENMATNFSIAATFNGIDNVSKTFNSFNATGNKVVGNLQKKFANLNKSVKNSLNSPLGKNLSMAGAIGGIAGIGAALKSAVTQGMEFEQSLTNATAKWGIQKGTKQFEELKKAARDVGKTTQYSATDAAKGLDYLAMAGFSATQAISALPNVTNLAIATNTDLARATDIASDALGAFNLMSKDPKKLSDNLAHMNDVIAKTTLTANADLSTMFETIKKSAPVTTSAGESLESVAAMIGIMAGAGIKGSVAGTTLNNMFNRLQAPTKRVKEILGELGIKIADNKGQMRPMADILGQLQKGMKGLTKVQKNAAMSQLFGAEAISGANILMQAGEKQIKKYANQLKNADGATKTLADQVSGTTLGRLKSLGSAVGDVAISFFDLNEGGLNTVITGITEFVRWVGNAIEKSPLLKQIISGLTMVIGGLVVVITATTLATTLLNAVMNLNPAVAVAMGIAALVAGLVIAYQKFESFRLIVDAAWQILTGLVNWGMSSLNEFFNMVYDSSTLVQEGVAGLVNWFGNLKDMAANLGIALVENVVKSIRWVLNLAAKIPGVGDSVKQLLDKVDNYSKTFEVNSTNTQKQEVSFASPEMTQAKNPNVVHKAELTIKDDKDRTELKQDKVDSNIAIYRTMG